MASQSSPSPSHLPTDSLPSVYSLGLSWQGVRAKQRTVKNWPNYMKFIKGQTLWNVNKDTLSLKFCRSQRLCSVHIFSAARSDRGSFGFPRWTWRSPEEAASVWSRSRWPRLCKNSFVIIFVRLDFLHIWKKLEFLDHLHYGTFSQLLFLFLLI